MPTDATTLPPPPRARMKGLKTTGAIAAVVALGAVVWGVVARTGETHQAQTWSNAQAIPTVSVIRPDGAMGGRILTLPGNLEAFNAAQINARVSGYLKTWDQDIGARVHAGQVLATLDTPELDQQVAQARADLASAQATQRLSQTTAKRWSDLLSSDAVSKQESEEKQGDLAARTALVRASQANLDRLLALKAFAKIAAPFDGVVTARNANIGDLVNAGAGGGQPLFTVSDVHKIRVYVRVPQSFSSQMRDGMAALLHLPEYPNRTFPATLVRTSGAINDQSGTLLAELSADNGGGDLKPGAFAQVDFKLTQETPILRLPASSLIFRKEGMQVATLDNNQRVRLKKIVIGRDLGPQVEVSSGVTAQDRIVDNPPDSIAEGELVRVGGVGRA